MGAAIPNWIIAVAAIGAVLHWLRDAMAPFALALILWLAIDSLARALHRRVSVLPFWLPLTVASALVLGSMSLVGFILLRSLGQAAANGAMLQARLDAVIANLPSRFGLPAGTWTLQALLDQMAPGELLAGMAAIVQSIAGSTTLILIYLLFLFPAAAAFSAKLPQMVPDPAQRARADGVLLSIRTSVERYLMVQTGVSVLITALSFVTLSLVGLQNPLFWSLLIFFLNYIPTLGSIIAVALPTLFALVQFPDDWRYAAAVAVGLHIWQFGVGTFLQPRMTGASLNLSTLVVVLSLAFWGALWGVTGVFLAAPMTVLVMIVLEQFPQTHWIAVLLSANGRPAPGSIGAAQEAPGGSG